MGQAQRNKRDLETYKAIGEINRRIGDAYMQGQREAIKETISLMLWVLHENEGFGNARLTRTYYNLKNLIDSVNDKERTLADIEAALFDECKIKIADVK